MENGQIYLLAIILIGLLNLLGLYFFRSKSGLSNDQEDLKKFTKEQLYDTRKELRELNSENRQELSQSFKTLQDSVLNILNESVKKQGDLTEAISEKFNLLSKEQKLDAEKNREDLKKEFESNNQKLTELFKDFKLQLTELNKSSKDSINEIRLSTEKHLEDIRKDNEKQLNEMRKTVDEKLQSTLEKRLGESFKIVSDRLEQVHKGLGEMQILANGVGDLKKVLSNVKTRGVLGEYQLGNILEEILTNEQYGKNVATKKGSQANVEYAVKLPGKESGKEVWMPIDSKFPTDKYQSLLEAFDTGDAQLIDTAQKALIKTIESFAKDIYTKYIDPPHTTDFAIMFLPIESLYAEVLRHPGLFETLQRKYHITVTGPTTLSALLNSLQMGFRTLAVQKRSSEVWEVLNAVKGEFNKFAEQLDKVQKHINTASGSLEVLRTTRTNQIVRRLKDVETFEHDAPKMLESGNDDVE